MSQRNSLSVIVPSRNATNLVACLGAVRQCEPWLFNGATPRIIVVDDGLTGIQAVPGPARILAGKKPFCFSTNINVGIQAAGGDDCLILNDDALLRTPGGFSLLWREAQAHPEYGVISATTNCCGNKHMYPQGTGELRDELGAVPLLAVVVPRRTIDKIGLLDERFTGYGYDDDDYCHRVRLVGLKIGIHEGCFVDHGKLKPTFRSKPTWKEDMAEGLKIFVEKWGHEPKETCSTTTA